MTLEEILDLWEKDCQIDRLELGEESLKIGQLHHKYLKIYSIEKKKLRELEILYKKLRHDKNEFFTMGHTKETKEKGWQLPPQGRIAKSEVSNYVDLDRDVIEMGLELGAQHEKIKELETIMDRIDARRWEIGNAIKWTMWINGK